MPLYQLLICGICDCPHYKIGVVSDLWDYYCLCYESLIASAICNFSQLSGSPLIQESWLLPLRGTVINSVGWFRYKRLVTVSITWDPFPWLFFLLQGSWSPMEWNLDCFCCRILAPSVTWKLSRKLLCRTYASTTSLSIDVMRQASI